eukprot:PhM_4_TR8341/c0_g1_i1/m.17910
MVSVPFSYTTAKASGLHPIQGDDLIEEPDVLINHLLLKFGVRNLKLMPDAVVQLLRSVCSPLVLDKERDVIFPMLMIKWSLTILPLWLLGLTYMATATTSTLSFALTVLLYYFLTFESLEQYILGLHCLVHRPCFVPSAKFLVTVYVWVLGVPFGEVPETYYSHHISMHHPANNGFDDISSTMQYQRDKPLHLFVYWVRFMFCQYPLLSYLSKVGNVKRAKSFVIGEATFWGLAILYTYFMPMNGFFFLLLPVVLVRTGMTVGNFGQHAFINPEDPFVNYNQSAVIVNSPYNRVGFNDGYHILHHDHPTAHYTELSLLFKHNLEKLAEHDSAVFDASASDGHIVDWVTISILLMQQRWDILAKAFVDTRAIVAGKPRRAQQEIEEMLKNRVRKVYSPERDAKQKKL